MYCKSCRWVKSNCGCTQTRSRKLLLVDLRLLHVVVELLLLRLLWSSKEPDLAYDNCTCCIVDKDIAASQKTLVIALSLAPRKPRASQVDPNAVSFGASEIDPNAISLPPGHGNPKPRIGRHPEDSAANSDPKTLQNPGTLKSWSITTMSLLFARGIVLCCGDTQSFIQDVSAIQFTYNIPSLASCASLYICDVSPCYFWCI